MRTNRTKSGRPDSRRTGGRGDVRPDGHKRADEKSRAGEASEGTEQTEGIRLNKYIARAGICSRRKADELIAQGQVSVNGALVKEMGIRVSEADEIVVGGRLISPRRHVYILLNKPKDTITTTDDPKDRHTVMDLINLPDKEKNGLFPVGRLDRDSVGVLLLTNDGDLAHRLMHPSFEIDKLYRVRTRKPVKPHELDQLRKGVELDDGLATADEAAYVALPDRHEIGLSIHEGRTRQVRRMFEALGHDVVTLTRVQYAGLTAQGVRPGKWRRLEGQEVRRLLRLVKLK